MENLESYKKRIKAIEEFSGRLESGELSIDELVQLETLTRELYERTVILKYKAFENKVNRIVESPLNLEDELDFVENIGENEIEESEPTIDFSIFDSPEIIEEPAAEVQIEIEEEIEEELIENKISNAVEEVVPEVTRQKETNVEAPIIENQSSVQGQSFWEQLNMNGNSISTQFEGAKIDTLVGAFGLNEKLRFINDLFDGSSESFSEAIKVLDTQANLDSAKIKSSELALKHGWDAEEESVVDFLMMVNRRYA
ncbi:MAG: hypothetical protein NWQ27_06315 [Crocinitomicaceae bacterium]|jgi:hypothetical protein|nr:hypothetical protein [Crocinitomicaceae bacterium]